MNIIEKSTSYEILKKLKLDENEFEKLESEEKRRIISKYILLDELSKIETNNRSYSELMKFHAKNKYLYFCHSISKKDELGRIVANDENYSIEEVFEFYRQKLSELMDMKISKGRKVNAYSHIFGYFSTDLTEQEKAEYFKLLDDFENSNSDDFALREKLFEFADKYKKEYILNQFLLNGFWWE
ncbi:DUF1722 domain-containing protein [Peptoniphilus asaccharolyticus]